MNDAEKFEEMSQKVSELHAFVLGVNGQGGLNRSVEALQTEVQSLSSFRSKASGVAAALGLLAGILGGKISKIIGQ